MIFSALLLSLTPAVFFQEPEATELEAAQRKVAELEATVEYSWEQRWTDAGRERFKRKYPDSDEARDFSWTRVTLHAVCDPHRWTSSEFKKQKESYLGAQNRYVEYRLRTDESSK